MKKILLFASALAGLFLAASCQQENLEPEQMAGTVKFTVEAPGAMATKTIADGMNVDEVHYEVYKNVEGVDHALLDPTSEPMAKGVVAMENKKANITLDLLQDQEYTVIFWAQVEGTGHYDTSDLRCVAFEGEVDANDESRAAFFKRFDFDTYEHKDYANITLRRPFAQLNLLTTMESLKPVSTGQTSGYEIDAKESQIIVSGLATSFNTVDGVGIAYDQPLTFAMAATPEEQGQATLTVNGKDYHYVSMNYMFVPVDAKDGSALVELKYEIVTDKGSIKHEIASVPIRENYRTNVIGNLFTKESKFEIIVDAEFDGQNLVDVWDGREVSEPAIVEGKYVISTAAELAWLAAAVNGTLPPVAVDGVAQPTPKPQKFNGKTFVLAEDINLANPSIEIPTTWTPIGVGNNRFEGTFDGQNHTISNLVVKTEGTTAAGLFGRVQSGYVKNVKVVNANVQGHVSAAVIVAHGVCAKIENCHVEDAVVVSTPVNGNEGNNVGAIAGFLGADGGSAYVKNSTVKNANITGYRKVGGVVGAANQAAVVTGNSIEASKVTADQTAEYKEVKAADLGAIVGYQHAQATEQNNTATSVDLFHKVDSIDELKAHAEGAQLILAEGTYDINEALSVACAIQAAEGTTVTINAAGNTITAGNNSDYSFIAKPNSTFVFNEANIISNGGGIAASSAGSKVIFNSGKVAVNATTTSGRYNFYVVGQDTEVTINGGEFSFDKPTLKRAYIYAGAGATVYVKGGTFGKPSTRDNYKAGIMGDGTVIVTGGTFGFDPTKWLAEGYTVKKEGQNWVVVGPAENTEDFLAALSYAKPGDVIYVAKSVILPSSFVTSTPGALTIQGVSEDAQVSFNTKAGGADGGLNCYADGMDLVFKNIKVVSPNTGTAYSGGFGRAKSVKFENCEYNGQYRAGSAPTQFVKCTIDPQTSYIYTDYVNVDFEECVFNCSEGKGIQVYNDGNSTNTTINVKDCAFTAAKHGATWDGKPVTAIDINSNGEVFTVNITNTTATGFPEGLATASTLFNIKGGAEYVTVMIDGSKFIANGLYEDEQGNAVATSEAGLKEALSTGGTVILANPFTIDQSESNGYGKTGINMTNGGTLDGNGNELGAPGSTGTWDSAINTSGGTIKNIKITKGFRGIFIKKDSKHNEKLYLDKVTIDGTTYTISCDSGNGHGLEATNSTFKGWTSYAGTLGNAKFTDCYFGKGNGYSYCRPYAPTEFVGCEFEAGFTLDPRAAVTFENCTLAGVALTADNISTLVTDPTKVTIK